MSNQESILPPSLFENDAKAYAFYKTKDTARDIVRVTLDIAGTLPLDTKIIREAEDHVESMLSRLLFHSLVEFTTRYKADLERRLELFLKLSKDLVECLPGPATLKESKQSE